VIDRTCLGPALRACVAGSLLLAEFLFIPSIALAQDGGALEEIVVTARKREETLQDTPVSITAFSGDMLEARHIERIDGIAAATPNLVIDQSANFSGSSSAASVFIRGIGQVDFTLTTEPGVGIYLDGVYVATSIGSILDLVDVERVEVLRGPQGTLFGRNTIGGAISVTSKLPDDEFHGKLKATTGRYDRIDVQGSVNIPITDTFYAQASAATYNKDGFVDAPNDPDGSELGDVNRDAGRIALRWVPTDRFEANFSADYTRVRENGVPHVHVGDYSGVSLAAIADAANPASPNFIPPPFPLPPPSFIDLYNLTATIPLGQQGGVPGIGFPGYVPNENFGNPPVGPGDVIDIENDELVNLSTMDLKSEADIWGVSLNLRYDFGPVSVKSITSYRDMEAVTGYDHGSVAQKLAQLMDEFSTEQFAEEVQLSGTAIDERLSWLVGGYYFTMDGYNLDDVEFPPGRFLSGAEIDNTSVAGFGQATFDMTEKLHLTAGIRYSDETKKFIIGDKCWDLPKGPEVLFDGTVVTCARMDTVIDPKIANPGFLGFVNAPVFPAPGGRFCCLPITDAQGNIVALIPGIASGDEILPAGTKKTTFDDVNLHFNVAYDWTDDLMTYFAYSDGFKGGGFVQRVFPPKTEVPSFEPETATVYEIGFKWNGFDDRLFLAAAGFHTDYDDLQIQINDGIAPVTRNAAAAEIDGFELEATVAPAAGWLVQGGVGYLDAEYTELDPRENFTTDIRTITLDTKLPNAPKWTTALGVQYDYEMPGGGNIIGRVDWSYRAKTYKDAMNFPEVAQDGYHLLDLSLSWISPSGQWEVAVFGKNVTDERYLVSGFANALTQGWASGVVGRPAEWGASVSYNFGN
jgi:iron complex outermembrane receptor protein